MFREIQPFMEYYFPSDKASTILVNHGGRSTGRMHSFIRSVHLQLLMHRNLETFVTNDILKFCEAFEKQIGRKLFFRKRGEGYKISMYCFSDSKKEIDHMIDNLPESLKPEKGLFLHLSGAYYNDIKSEVINGRYRGLFCSYDLGIVPDEYIFISMNQL